MKTKYLFPHRYKMIGWIIFVPMVILGLIYLFVGENVFPEIYTAVPALIGTDDSLFHLGAEAFTFEKNNIIDELLVIGITVGGMLVAFSKEKMEDEYISRLRVESLVWAMYVSYGLLLLFTIFIYGSAYFTFMMISMFSVLVVFIFRFNYILFRTRKTLAYEQQS